MKKEIEELLNDLNGTTTEEKDNQDSRFDLNNPETIYRLEAIAGCILLVCLIIVASWLYFRRNGGEERDLRNATIEKTETIEIQADGTVTDEVNVQSEAVANLEAGESESTDVTVDLSKSIAAKRKPIKGELPQAYTAGKCLTYTGDDYQLPELFAYWDDYSLDAVNDIIRLDRFRPITDALAGSNDFYYYGETDSSGQPSGKGLGVYAYNTYYFGDWKNGMRDGKGMWYRIFPEKDGIVNGITEVDTHMYNGQWKADFPNGEGQEMITYANEKAIEAEYAILDAIGSFKDGYYDKDMYLLMLYKKTNHIDWYGSCSRGVFDYIADDENILGKRPIMRAGEGQETDEEKDYYWLLPKDNCDFGIAGLKK